MAENSKYYWIKLRTDFFNQDTIGFLLSQKNGCEYVVLYQMLCLNTANSNGELISKIGEMIIPYDVEKIVRDTKYFDFDTVTIAIELFKKLGLIYESDNTGTLRIAEYSTMIGSESASREAEKKRKYRAKLKGRDILGYSTGDNLSDRDKILDIRDKRLEIDIRDKDKKSGKPLLSLVEDYTSNQDLQEAFKDFIEMRKKMKAPLTYRALKICLTKLDSYADTDEKKIAVIEQSIERGWKGLFPLKDEPKQEDKSDMSKYDFVINNF